MGGLSSITTFDTACDTVEHLQCEIGGCCPCSEQEITQCVLDNTGEVCGNIDCGFTAGGQDVGEDTTATESSCGFCPGGYNIENEDAMYGDVDIFNGTLVTLSLTCGEFHRVLEKIPDDLCGVYQGDILDRTESYPHQCGYCEILQEEVDSCTLCPDGSTPTEPVDTVVNDDNETCGFFQYFALYQEASSNICSQVQQIGVDSCGCTMGASGLDTSPTSSGPQLGGVTVFSFVVVGISATLASFM